MDLFSSVADVEQLLYRLCFARWG